MSTWKWLYSPSKAFDWRFLRRVTIKTLILLIVINVVAAYADPLPALGKLSIYNWLVPGRQRLPYGENSSTSYNLSLYQIEAMFASHQVADADPEAYRVFLLGDSSIWGILLKPEETLAGQINSKHYYTSDGRRIHVYNLGYPTMSLTKDLLLLDYAMRYKPDLIVWAFTLESFDQATQLDSAIVQNNPDRVRELIRKYALRQSSDDPAFVERSRWDQTIVANRRAYADVLRLQFYGVMWGITGIDQEYRDDYVPRAVDLEPDDTWHGLSPRPLSEDLLAFDVLRAGIALAADTPVLLINEPMLLSTGQNREVRYNAFFPRWAYDQYRALLRTLAQQEGWQLRDLWASLPAADCYTDSAVHLTPECSKHLANLVGPIILQVAR